MYKNILFISDSSLTNQILHSQGLPLLGFLKKNGFAPSIITFEHILKSDEDEKIITKIINEYQNEITFYQNVYQPSKLLPSFLQRIFSMYSEIKKIVLKQNIQVIHARGLIPAIIVFLVMYFSKINVKMIYDNRGVFIDEEIYKGTIKKGSLKEKILRWFEIKIVETSDAIIVVSNAFRNYMLDTFLNVKKLNNKITTIANGSKFSCLKKETFKRDEHKNYIGVYSGSAGKWQNITGVHALINYSIKRLKKISYIIYSYEKKVFQKYFSDLSNNENFLGIVALNSSEVEKKLLEADFALMIREKNLINKVAAPLKFAEYLSAGLPVMISEGIGDTEEIIVNNKVGVIVRNENYEEALEEMIQLLSEPNIKQKCKEISNKYLNINTCFEQYLEIYNKLC